MAMILGRRHVLDLVDLPPLPIDLVGHLLEIPVSGFVPMFPGFPHRCGKVRKSWVSCVGFLGKNPGFEARILEKSQFLRFFWDFGVLRLHARLLASLVGLTRLLDQLLTKHLAADSTSKLG